MWGDTRTRLRPSLANGCQNVSHYVRLRLRALVALAVEADADGVGLHVARAEDEHGVDFGFFGALDFAVDLVGAVIAFGADHVGAELGDDAFRITHKRLIVADREDADLFGREPEREVAGVMLDQEADETFVRAERRTMNAKWSLFGVVAVFVNEIETSRLREIDLIGRDRKLAPDRAPGLHVDLRAVKRRFVSYFDKVDPGILEHVPCHYFRLFPKLRFIDKLLSELRGIVCREAHQIFLDPEELEIFQIHLVDGVELRLELLRCHVEVSVVHLHRAHSHEPEQLATLLVAITGAILRQPQRQIAITARNRREQLVVMRTVHRLQVVILAKI